MTILAIDTSTSRGSVAVLADGKLTFSEDFTADRSHSATLFTILARAKEAGPPFQKIVIGLGPGSYAGVRIAIAAAIGLQLATGAELVGLPSVTAWDTGVARYVATGDARRETYYWTRIENGVCAAGPELITAEEWRVRLRNADVPIFASDPLPGSAEIRPAYPSAALLAQFVANGVPATPAPLEPIYLREAHISKPKA